MIKLQKIISEIEFIENEISWLKRVIKCGDNLSKERAYPRMYYYEVELNELNKLKLKLKNKLFKQAKYALFILSPCLLIIAFKFLG